MEKNRFNSVISFRNGLIISISVIIIYLIILILFQDNKEGIKIFSDIGTLFVNFFVILALYCSVKALKGREDPGYKVWFVFLFAQTAYLLGDLLWAVFELLLNQNPFPSVADLFYIAYYPLFILGIMMIPRVSTIHHRGFKFVLDMGIIVVSSLIFFWTFLILPILQNSAGDLLSNFVSILYIALDFVLLFALFNLTLDKIKNIRDWTLILLASGISAQIIADIIYSYQTTQGTYYSGGILEIGWIISFLLIALAGLWEANHGKKLVKDVESVIENVRPTWVYYMPYGLVILAFIILSLDYFKLDYQNWILVDLGVGVIILLVVIRQILSINENRNLYLQADAEIKKRKQTEKVLKKEKRRAERYFNVAGVFMLILDDDGYVQLINQKGCEILGYESQEITGSNWFQFIPFYSEKKVKNLFQNLRVSESIESQEYAVLSKDGCEKIISWHITPLKEGGTLSSGEDITQERIRENKEKKLIEQTMERQDALLELTSFGDLDLELAFKTLIKKDAETMNVERVSIWYFSEDKKRIQCKCLYDQLKDRYESGHTLSGEDYPHYFQAVQESRNVAVHDVISDPTTKELNETYLYPNNIFSLLDVPIWIQGKQYGILSHEKVNEYRNWSFEDQDYAAALANLISRYIESHERRKAEENIKASLDEKEILLQEIHHRVKNNMQIISSLMSLQSRYLDDERASEVFLESQNRVKSMAIIHEKLYQSEGLDRINLKNYIKSILSNLISSYMSSSGEIKINTELQDVYLNMDTSIPVGLIINELITNSFKHAFPDNSAGQINISMEIDQDQIEITIKDNGVGIPEGLDLDQIDSLGLSLVNSLIKQIDGTIEFENNNGAIFRIRFKEVKPQI